MKRVRALGPRKKIRNWMRLAIQRGSIPRYRCDHQSRYIVVSKARVWQRERVDLLIPVDEISGRGRIPGRARKGASNELSFTGASRLIFRSMM